MSRRAPTRRAQHLLVPVVIGVGGLLGVLAVTLAWQRSLDDQRDARATVEVDAIGDALRDALDDVVAAAEAAVERYGPASTAGEDPDTWQADLSRAQSGAPWLAGLHYIELVDAVDVPAFAARFARETGLTLETPDGDGPVLVVARGAPSSALGTDVTVAPASQVIAQEALSSTGPTLQAVPDALVDAAGADASGPLLMVVVPDRGPFGTVSGFGTAAFVGQDLVQAAQRAAGNGYGLRVTWPGGPVGDATAANGEDAGEPLTASVAVPPLSDDLTAVVTPVESDPPGPLDAGPLGLLVGGALATLLFAALVATLAAGQARARRQVTEAVATLAGSEQRLQALVRHAADVIAVVDADGRFTWLSPSTSVVFGGDPEQFVGRRVVDVVSSADGRRAVNELATLPAGETRRREAVLRGAQGPITVELVVTNLLGDPAVKGYVVNVHDVTDRKAYETLLAHEARHDPLTGLANRTQLLDALEAARHHAQLEGGSFAVLFMDLDRFKDVNDEYGHDAGDRVLQQVATRLRRAVRTDDTVVRLGGDEFVIVCPGASHESAAGLGRRIGEAISVPYHHQGTPIRVSASIGVAVGDGTHPPLDDLVREADQDMFRSKDDSRG